MGEFNARESLSQIYGLSEGVGLIGCDGVSVLGSAGRPNQIPKIST